MEPPRPHLLPNTAETRTGYPVAAVPGGACAAPVAGPVGPPDPACGRISDGAPLAPALDRHRERLSLLPALEAAEQELARAAKALTPRPRSWWPFSRARPTRASPADRLRLQAALRALELQLWALDRELPLIDADRRALSAAEDPGLRRVAEDAAALLDELTDQRAALRALLETASTHDPGADPSAEEGPPGGFELVELAEAAAAVLHPRTAAWAERAQAFDREAAGLRAAAAEVDAALTEIRRA